MAEQLKRDFAGTCPYSRLFGNSGPTSGSSSTYPDVSMGELAIRYRSRPGPQFFANRIVRSFYCVQAFGVPSFDLSIGIGSSVFVLLEQFHNRSHVQLTQTLADGFPKKIFRIAVMAGAFSSPPAV